MRTVFGAYWKLATSVAASALVSLGLLAGVAFAQTLSGSGNFLPLTGGTLTGALSGTSATFSGNVTALGLVFNGHTNTSIVNGADSGGSDSIWLRSNNQFNAGVFTNDIRLRGVVVFGWSATSIDSGPDTGLSRTAAATVALGNGTASNTTGTLVLTNVLTVPVAVASLPTCDAANAGKRAFVNNANATTFASTVAGGGANDVPVYCDGDGAAWKIG